MLVLQVIDDICHAGGDLVFFCSFWGTGVTRNAGNMSRRLPRPELLEDVVLVKESVGGGFGDVFGQDVG